MRRKLKKALAVTLASVMIAGIVPNGAFASQSGSGIVSGDDDGGGEISSTEVISTEEEQEILSTTDAEKESVISDAEEEREGVSSDEERESSAIPEEAETEAISETEETETEETSETEETIGGKQEKTSGAKKKVVERKEDSGEEFICDGNYEMDKSLVNNLKKIDQQLNGSSTSYKARAKQNEVLGTGLCPSEGNVHSLVVMVDFDDITFANDFTKEYVEQIMFGEPDTSSERYPKESLNAWYQRSSYGKLSFYGEVVELSMEHTKEYYTYDADTDIDEELYFWDEIWAYIKDMELDWSEYDLNEDHYLDSFCIIVAGATSEWASQWWSKVFHGYMPINDTYKISTYGMFMESHMSGPTTAIHEFGHCLGLPDLYDTSSSDTQSGYGINTSDMMNSNLGDFNALCKMLLGWIDAEQVQLIEYGTDIGTITLDSYTETGACALLFLNEGDTGIFDEYYLIQYMDFYGNDSEFLWKTKKEQLRIYHVNAELDESGNTLLHDNRMSGDCKLIESVDKDVEYIHGSMSTTNMDIMASIWGAIFEDKYQCGYFSGDEFTPYTAPSSAKYAEDRLADSVNVYSGLYITDINFMNGKAFFNVFYEEAPIEKESLSLTSIDDLEGCSANNLRFQVLANHDIWLIDSDKTAYIRKKGETESVVNVLVEKPEVAFYFGGHYSFYVKVDAGVRLEDETAYEVVFPAGMFVTSYGAISEEIVISGIGTEINFWDTDEINCALDSEKYIGTSKNFVLNENGNFEIVARSVEGAIYICELKRDDGCLLKESLVLHENGDIKYSGYIKSFGQSENGNYWIIADSCLELNALDVCIINSDKKLVYSTIVVENRPDNASLLKNNKLALGYSGGGYRSFSGYILDMEKLELSLFPIATGVECANIFMMGDYLLVGEFVEHTYKDIVYNIEDYNGNVLKELDLEGLSITNVIELDDGYDIYGNQENNIVRYQLNADFSVRNKIILFRGKTLNNIYQLGTGYLMYCYTSNSVMTSSYFLLDWHYNLYSKINIPRPSYGITYRGNILIDGNEYLVATSPYGNNFRYQISSNINVPEGDKNDLEKLVISQDIHLDDDGYVIIDDSETLIDFVNNINPVSDETYSIVKVNGNLYIKVSSSNNKAEKYYKVFVKELEDVVYTVTFDLQGHGAELAEYSKYKEIPKGSTINRPTSPEATNYKFTGWYRDIQCTVLWDFETDTIEDDIILYAGWDVVETEIETETESESSPESETEPETKPEPSKEVYTIYFELQGHGIALEEYSKYTGIPKGSTINNPTPPVAEGYKFTGWYKDEQCTILWNFETDTVEGDTILYAGWEPEREPDNPDNPPENIPDGIWIAEIEDYTYTGKAIIPSVDVYYNKKKLTVGRDYTITYQNNTKAATASAVKKPTVIVKGKGNYSGTKKAFFTINKAQLEESSLKAAATYPIGVKYTPVVVSSGNILKAGTDYTLIYLDANGEKLKKQPTKEGNYQMHITGKGNCEGEISFPYSVSKEGGADMINKGTATVSNITYGGKEPDVTLTVNGKNLTRDTDYIVQFANTGKKGTATATFIGIGRYAGTLKKNFKVQAAVIQEKDINVVGIAAYEKGGAKAKVSVTVGGVGLNAGTDYTVSYKNNTKVGNARVTVKGKGNYTGSLTKDFKVEPKSLTADGLKILVSEPLKGKKPTVTVFDTNGKKLSANSDYKAVIDRIAHQVTVIGGKNGLYKAQEPITIAYHELEKGRQVTSVTLNKKAGGLPKYFEYTGKEVKLEKDWLTVKAGKTILKSSEFEIIGYVNNIEKGTATIIIRGAEGYGGIKMLNFKIKAKGLL